MFKEFFIETSKTILITVVDSSYSIFLTLALVALLLYICGQRKAGKYVSISFVIYVILQSIKGVIIWKV